jgi:pilus assembly protein TadC
MLFSVERADKFNRRFLWIGEFLKSFFPRLERNLEQAEIPLSAERYLSAAFFSALVYGVVFFFLFYFLFFIRNAEITPAGSVLPLLIALAFFFVFFFILIISPGLSAKNYSRKIDQKLLFALKSMLVQVSSDVSLFDAIANVGKADYGAVSREFAVLAREISSGMSEADALERMALATKSDYLKKTAWQLSTAIKSGASLQKALASIVENLANKQARDIKDYAAELNLWILMYLLLAAAVPTLGITFLVILSSLGGASIGTEHVIMIVLVSFAVQVALIGFVKNRVPQVF